MKQNLRKMIKFKYVMKRFTKLNQDNDFTCYILGHSLKAPKTKEIHLVFIFILYINVIHILHHEWYFL